MYERLVRDESLQGVAGFQCFQIFKLKPYSAAYTAFCPCSDTQPFLGGGGYVNPGITTDMYTLLQ